MNIKAVYKCRNCRQEFEDPTVYDEDVTVESMVTDLSIMPQYNKIYLPSTSTVYRGNRLDAKLTCFHDCPICMDDTRGQAKRIGIADLIGLIPLEGSEPKAE